MQKVFIKVDELKIKFLKLQNAYKNIQLENLTLNERVIELKEKIEKQNTKKSENTEIEGVKTRVDDCIREIDEVIKILS
jgi:hypothetical protein